VRTIQLRTKLLLSLLAISAGLTTGTLLVVRYNMHAQVRDSIREDLRNSVNTYEIFEKHRREASTQSVRLIANLPYLRALMTTRDAATIADGSIDIWRLSGSDLLALADQTGKVQALTTNWPGFTQEMAQGQMRRLLDREKPSDWWFGDGHLYEVWMQPIYFGEASDSRTTGYLAVGYEVDQALALNFSKVASSEVAFHLGDRIVASTLTSGEKLELERSALHNDGGSSPDSYELDLGNEHYLMSTLRLSDDPAIPVSMTVLKSLDKASLFLSRLNRVLLALGLISVMAGSILVFLISRSFMRPLAKLVAGVRALERGDYAYPLENKGGDEVAEVTQAFGTMRATLQKTQEEQKLLEQRLRQAHKMEAVGRLAGGVAHDFNNLLTIIRGHGDLLLDRGIENASQQNSVEQIKKAADRAVSMTRQLLAFSRLQVLQPRVIDLNAVVAEMGKMLPRLIGEHIEYLFIPDSNLACVKADPGQIEQVIMNLAVNARDAMPDGGKLLVQTRNVELNEAETRNRPPMSPGAYVLFSVSDTGHGMDEKTKAHIFEPFFTTKEVGKGTGLGLATVYGVVKQSGGFIWVESSPGQGAAFEIYFPQVSEKISEKEEEAKSVLIPPGTETVLVVEDQDGVRELTAGFLRANGYSVLEAVDGLDALEVAKRFGRTIHAVLTDIVMPRMGGVELAKRLIAHQPGTKIILMSGYSDQLGNEKDEAIASFLILQKPFSMNSLAAALRETLEGRILTGNGDTRVKQSS
jgi:signal transduction histidine kinase/ActR/RegA family two-component response regulator